MILYDLMLIFVMILFDLMLIFIMYQDLYFEFFGVFLLGGLDYGLELFDFEGEVGDLLDYSDILGYCVFFL